MPKCVYCGNEYEIPRGLTLVTNDGKINYLCSSKCRKNMLMKRRKVRWISKAKKSKEDIKKEIKAQVESEKSDDLLKEKSSKSKESSQEKK